MSNIQEAPCPLCGALDYTWGYLQGDANVKFKPDDAGFWASFTILGGSEVRSRLCRSCGNIQLFVSQFERSPG